MAPKTRRIRGVRWTGYSVPLVLSVLLTLVAVGQQPPPEAVIQKVALNIEPQPVGDALNELGRQTGLVIIVYSSVGRGTTAPRITGRLTAETALARILANTGLRYEYLDAKTIAVLPAERTPARAPADQASQKATAHPAAERSPQ